MSRIYDAVIIGAGASGLACAAGICLSSSKNPDILIIDVNKKSGRKLLATGNGRCNLSNTNISPEHYFGDVSLCKNLLGSDAYNEVRGFFEKLSLIMVNDDEGRIYPNSKQAQSVLSVLMSFLENNNVSFTYETEVTEVQKIKSLYIVKSKGEEVCRCRNLVISTGGSASPSLSSGKNGYKLVNSLGHTVTPLYPALTQLKTADKFLNGLSGVRCRVKVTLNADGNYISSESGELQITDKAISGICIFDLSVYVGEFFSSGSINGMKYNKLAVSLDFLPDMDFNSLLKYVGTKRELQKNSKAGNLLDGLVNLKLSNQIIKYLKIDPEKSLSKLNSAEAVRICRQLKSTELVISGTNSWNDAQVTAGGVPISDINVHTMESLKCRNLYLCGELLNIHGMCGGYNLNFAWITGLKAGKNIAEKTDILQKSI